MNTFRSSELSDLLSNRFRLENSHSPSYLAECLQRMSPSLNRMSLSSITEELAKANGRAFNSSRLPIRGETLNFSFFFELWRRNFRFTSGIYDKFVFTPELQLAFKINPRDFWEVLVRADRELGTLLKDSYTAYNLRELPQEISINLTAGRNGDDKEILEAVKKSVGRLSVVSTVEIEAACLKLFPNLKQVFSGGNFIEKFCAENSIRKLSREPFFIIPVSRLEKITWKFLRGRISEYSVPDALSSVGMLTKQELMVRGEEVKEEKKTSSAPNYEGYYWKNGASGTPSENLKKKINLMVSALREYYISSGQNHKVGELRQSPLILTSVKMRPVKEQIGYIFDEYEADTKNTEGSYRNFRKDMVEYFKKFHLTESKENAYTAFLKQYGSEKAIEKVFIDRKLYHIGGNAVDIRINPPFTDDIVALSKTKTLSYVVYLALIHTVGKGGEHLHVSFTYN